MPPWPGRSGPLAAATSCSALRLLLNRSLRQHPHLAAHPCCPTPADVLSMLPFVQLLSSAANEEQQQACAEVLLAALREPQSAVARAVRTIAANTLGGV